MRIMRKRKSKSFFYSSLQILGKTIAPSLRSSKFSPLARFIICLHHSAYRLIWGFWTLRRKFLIVSKRKGIHKHIMSYSQQDSFLMPLILISIRVYMYLSLKCSVFLPFLQRIIMPWNKKLYLCLCRIYLREKLWLT